MDDAAAVLLQEDRIPQLSRPVVGRLADVAAALGNEHQALFIRRCTPQRRVNSTARRGGQRGGNAPTAAELMRSARGRPASAVKVENAFPTREKGTFFPPTN